MNIILAVTASVAAIKTLPLAKALTTFAKVRIISTEKAAYFFKSDYTELKNLNIQCHSDGDEWPPLVDNQAYSLDTDILHIALRRWADALLIAPMDANTLAKISHGLCDNLITSVVRAWDWKKPMVLCPAMNTQMWENKPTAEQIAFVQNLGANIIEPIEKMLACKDLGMGAMAEVTTIAAYMKSLVLNRNVNKP